MASHEQHERLAHQTWGREFTAGPDLCSAASDWRGGLLRRWTGTASTMRQPRLDHHYAVLHLGGSKRIRRSGDGATLEVEAKPAAFSLVPAGATHEWSTQGPINFAHLYINPETIRRVVRESYDRDPREVTLTPCVGREEPVLAALFAGIMAELEAPGGASRLALDVLFQSFLVLLIRRHSTLATFSTRAPHSLAPRRLRRVLDFIEDNLADDLELDDLASVAGSSRFHFSRAFRDATGFPPYRYLVHRRINAAKALLLDDVLSVEEIAAACGFKSAAQFAVMFKQVFGTTPSRFRREA